MNKDALLIWNKHGKASETIYGTKAGSPFAEDFNPKQDIDPKYVENIVYIDTASFIDRAAADVTNIQKVGAGLMSHRRYLELSPDCDDVELELQRIKQEQMEEQQMQMQAQMQMQMQMQPPMAPSGETAPVEGANAPGGPVPPEGAENAPEDQSMPSMTGETEDILGPVADVFRGIAKIRGQVFLVGEILNDGLTADEIAAGSLEVVVSEPIDKQTILNGVRQTEIGGFARQGKIVFHENMDMLNAHPYLEVTPGTSGTEVLQGEQPPPEETDVGPGLPEEEMAPGMEQGMAPPGMEGMGAAPPPEMMGMM
jgi:hypothetical protein